ncbi:MAG: hypothetical protein ABI193_10780 [Minicystis sp.]
MTAASPISLGDFFSRFPFPDEERTRLAALVVNGGVQARIIKMYVTKTAGYKKGFLKAERIRGSRPGSSLYNEQAIQRIVSHLGEPSNHKYKLYWSLYKDAAVAFIKKELPALDRLLAEVRSPDGVSAVADVLKELCAKASEYEVTPEHITTFYDIWGVPRIANFETLLPQWLKADESNAQKRLGTRLLFEVAELKRSLLDLATQLKTQQDVASDDRATVTAARDRWVATDKEVQSLSRKVSTLLAQPTGDEATARVEERIAALAEKVNKLVERAKAPREDISTRDLQKFANETKLGVATSLSEVTETITKNLRAELATATSDFDARLSTLAAEFSKRRESAGIHGGGNSSGGAYRSPLLGPLSHTLA